MQHHACWAIGNLAVGRKENRVPLSSAGAHIAAIAAMQRLKGNVDVATQGCWALAGLALSSRNQKIIPREHGIKTILTAMKQHGHRCEGVQLNGCWAIGNLALEPENREKTAKFKGHQSVIQAMRWFPQSPGVQQYGGHFFFVCLSSPCPSQPATLIGPS